MTREEAKAEINKVFEPAFANYIIEALTEGETPSERKTGRWNDETRQKVYELECENRILRHCLAEAFEMEHRAGVLVRGYSRLIDTRQGYDEQVEEFEAARREYDRFEERKAMGKVVNVDADVPHYEVEPTEL